MMKDVQKLIFATNKCRVFAALTSLQIKDYFGKKDALCYIVYAVVIKCSINKEFYGSGLYLNKMLLMNFYTNLLSQFLLMINL